MSRTSCVAATIRSQPPASIGSVRARICETVGWERIVAATQEVRDMYPLQWAVYRLHVIHVTTGEQWRGDGGTLRLIADKAGVSIATVIRWRHMVPRRIARAALT